MHKLVQRVRVHYQEGHILGQIWVNQNCRGHRKESAGWRPTRMREFQCSQAQGFLPSSLYDKVTSWLLREEGLEGALSSQAAFKGDQCCWWPLCRNNTTQGQVSCVLHNPVVFSLSPAWGKPPVHRYTITQARSLKRNSSSQMSWVQKAEIKVSTGL